MMVNQAVPETEKFETYLEHALVMKEREVELRDELLPELPEEIIDSHTHFGLAESCNPAEMPERILGHMMCTFITFTFEQSHELDRTFFPGKSIVKARFPHVFPNVDKRIANGAVKETRRKGDYPFLFGVSDTPEDIDYTVSELESGDYYGLKMYYMATEPPKYKVYEYFPKPVLGTAERTGTPIVLHLPYSLYESGQEVIELAQDYPDLGIILAHVGVANIARPEIDKILASFAEFPNVYVDTALVDSTELIQKAIIHLGARRVLYGSDEPLSLLRTQTFYNPKLESPRVLTDYPYHWADPMEQAEFRHLITEPLVHNHWRQLQSLLGAIALESNSPHERQTYIENVFWGNAKRLLEK